MRGFVRFIFFLGVLLIFGAAVYAILAFQPELGPIPPPQRQSFDPPLVERGATLAAIDSCGVCHTGASGRQFAGGLELAAPFGAIFSTNITPDLAITAERIKAAIGV